MDDQREAPDGQSYSVNAERFAVVLSAIEAAVAAENADAERLAEKVAIEL